MSSSWSKPLPFETSKTDGGPIQARAADGTLLQGRVEMRNTGGGPIQELADLITRAMDAEARRVSLEREQELVAEQSQKARAEAIESWNAAHSILVRLLSESRPTSMATHLAHLLDGVAETGKR